MIQTRSLLPKSCKYACSTAQSPPSGYPSSLFPFEIVATNTRREDLRKCKPRSLVAKSQLRKDNTTRQAGTRNRTKDLSVCAKLSPESEYSKKKEPVAMEDLVFSVRKSETTENNAMVVVVLCRVSNAEKKACLDRGKLSTALDFSLRTPPPRIV